MNKILVTTDFSSNSKAGLRFAVQLASQCKCELVFFHSYNVAKPVSWKDEAFASFEKSEADKIQKKLNQFVASVYKSMKVSIPENKKCVIKSSVFADTNIREYAQENEFNFICISTRGAGSIKRILGTNTSSLITYSDVPILAIPHSYRTNKITSILYASDLANLERELKKVVAFAKPLEAKVELLHFKYLSEIDAKEDVMNKAVKKFSEHSIKLHLENIDLVKDLVSNIEGAIKQSKPSIVVMFTQQNRSFFEKLFISSLSAEYSFNAKVPLLVFNKV